MATPGSPTLADKAELIKRELNLKRGGSVADVVKAANEQLGNTPASRPVPQEVDSLLQQLGKRDSDAIGLAKTGRGTGDWQTPETSEQESLAELEQLSQEPAVEKLAKEGVRVMCSDGQTVHLNPAGLSAMKLVELRNEIMRLTSIHCSVQRLFVKSRELLEPGDQTPGLGNGDDLFVLIRDDKFPQQLGPFNAVPTPLDAGDFCLPSWGETVGFDGGMWLMERDAVELHGVKPTSEDNVQFPLLGQLSPLAAVTLSDPDKVAAKIPLTAKFFCWSYPVAQWGSLAASDQRALIVKGFLALGGFVYLNAKHKVVGTNTVVPSPRGGLQFGPPRPWLREWTAGLMRQKHASGAKMTGRFHRTTLQALKNVGAQKFAWLLPGEVLRDEHGVQFPQQPVAPHGAFVYLFPTSSDELQLDRYFPITSPMADVADMQNVLSDDTQATRGLLEDLMAEHKEINAVLSEFYDKYAGRPESYPPRKRRNTHGASTIDKVLDKRTAVPVGLPPRSSAGVDAVVDSLTDRVSRIQVALELDRDLSMPATIKRANTAMGMKAEGGLPEQANALLSALGVDSPDAKKPGLVSGLLGSAKNIFGGASAAPAEAEAASPPPYESRAAPPESAAASPPEPAAAPPPEPAKPAAEAEANSARSSARMSSAPPEEAAPTVQTESSEGLRLPEMPSSASFLADFADETPSTPVLTPTVPDVEVEVTNERAQQLADQLTLTQMRHVAELKTLRDTYAKPLREQGLLTQEEVARIFANLDKLIELDSLLLERMRETGPHLIKRISRAFIEVGVDGELEVHRFVDLYLAFCRNIPSALVLLEKRRKEHPPLDAFLAEKLAENYGIGLENYLNKPVQRLEEARWFFTDLQQEVEPDHPHRQHLEMAARLMVDVSLSVDMHLGRAPQQQPESPARGASMGSRGGSSARASGVSAGQVTVAMGKSKGGGCCVVM